MKIEIKKVEELYEPNNFFIQMLENVFDAGLLMDHEGKLIYVSKYAFPHQNNPEERKALVGKKGALFDRESPFATVLETGKPIKNFVLKNALNQTNISHIFPIYCENKVAGLFTVLVYDKMSNIKKVLEQENIGARSETKELYDLLARTESNYILSDFIGESALVQQMLTICTKAAKTDYPILITGETGTGKEIIANGIHAVSRSKNRKPLVKINCTAIVDTLFQSELFGHEKGAFTGALANKKGKFEIAENGSILLDEIEAMNLNLQGKILRVLEEREFEHVGGHKIIPLQARVIASTNQNLKKMAKEGTFRLDLYHRLNVIEIKVPPLRDRKSDIPLLIRHFEKSMNTKFIFEREAFLELMSYGWPGNVRELKHFLIKLSISVEGNVTKKDVLDILEKEEQEETKHISLVEREKEALLSALYQCEYRMTATAAFLGISRATLYRRMKKMNIHCVKIQ